MNLKNLILFKTKEFPKKLQKFKQSEGNVKIETNPNFYLVLVGFSSNINDLDAFDTTFVVCKLYT